MQPFLPTISQLLRPAAPFAVAAALLFGAATPLPAQLLKKLPGATQAANTGMAGTWAGTAREQVEGAGNIAFPIELQFTGGDDALQLTVKASVKVPTEDGRRVTVQIHATYRGTCRDGNLRMRSERIDVRVQETGEQVPSEPQEIEGTRKGNELTGRVGSAEEGWSTFTATRAAPVAVGMPPALIGQWRGTAREAGPDGKEITYPVGLQVQGSDDALVADLKADVRYPRGDGTFVRVEFRGEFRGRLTGGELRLRAERTKMRLVDGDRTEDGPAQDLIGRLDGDLLRVRIGEESDPTTIELRREGATNDGTAANAEGAPVRTDGANTTVDPAVAARYATLVLQRTEIKDPGMGGITSHTMMVPRGWRFEGGVRWTSNPNNYVHFVGTLQGQHDESVTFDWTRMFTWSESSLPGMPPPRSGEQLADGNVVRQPPRQPGEVAVEVVLPALVRNATDVRLVDVRPEPKVAEALQQKLRPQFELVQQANQNSDAPGQPMRMRTEPWCGVERARVRYRDGDREWEADVLYSLIGYRTTTRSDAAVMSSDVWVVLDVQVTKARPGELDACLPALRSVTGTLRETPRWSAALGEIRLALAEAQTRRMRGDLDEIIRRGQQAAANRAELSDLQMKGWRERQDSNDRIHKANIDAIRGVQDFRSADGDVHSVSNLYDRAFVGNKDTLILTNDPNYRPAADPLVDRITWEEMQRVDPFRRDGR